MRFSTKKVCVIFLLLSQVLLLVWMMHMYIRTRLELMEARNLIWGIYKRNTVTRRLLRDGIDTGRILGRLSTNQHFVVQYAVRRNIMRSDMFSAMFGHYKQGDLDLNAEELKWFQAYRAKCIEWEGGGNQSDFKCRIPIVDRIEMFLYIRWDDCMELWQTWKPNDIETNIKIVPPKEPYADDPVSVKIYRYFDHMWKDD
jgi:hypothetical protein